MFFSKYLFKIRHSSRKETFKGAPKAYKTGEIKTLCQLFLGKIWDVCGTNTDVFFSGKMTWHIFLVQANV